MMIDLRSDTVTKPTSQMLEAMFAAQVGDDVFGADPTVNELQMKIASLFGMEDALFCPSGTMTNQIALRINTVPQDEVICDKDAHIYLYEGGGMMSNSMISPKLLNGDRGRITAQMVETNINPDDVHRPRTRLVAVENTMNKGGGSIYEFEEIKSIAGVCKSNNLAYHLDGARLFNALVETKELPKEFGAIFDTISICFSKGLGAPIGSVLLGSKEKMHYARRVRKVFGGGMRQVGYLAAACIYALDHHVDRLIDDHNRAREIGAVAATLPYVKRVFPADTNIVILELVEGKTEHWLLDKLKEKELLTVGFGPGLVRFVTHLDFDDDQLTQTLAILKGIE
jgi:threonine aldolase